MRRVTRERPAIVYLHPYEMDLEPGPEEFERALAAAPLAVRLLHRRQLHNRASVARKIDRLLREFDFVAVRDLVRIVLATEDIL